MIKYTLLLALLVAVSCQAPSPQSHEDTNQLKGIHSSDTLVPNNANIDDTRGQLLLMPNSFYLSHPNISDSAKLLYTRSIIPMDENYTFCVFDSLETANDTLLPFYFYTTLIISEQSDGAVSEVVGLTVHSFTFHHPKQLQKLLALPDVVKGKTNRDIWLHWHYRKTTS